MKRIDFVKPSDYEQIYEAFMGAQLTKQDCSGKSSGFYEYRLSEDEIRKRVELSAQEGLGLVLRDKNKIKAYLLAYRASQARGVEDEVLQAVSVPDNAIYADQLFITPGMPIYAAGRLVDAWNNAAMSRYDDGVFSAVPWRPWRNVLGTRFNFARGGRISGFLAEKGLDLAIFTNPLTKAGRDAREFEIVIQK